MGNALISRRGGGYATVKFDNYAPLLPTQSTPTALSQARERLAATTVGSYALFGGGYNGSSYYSTVDAYNNSLTRSTPTALSQARGNLAATTVGSYALFGGGIDGGAVSTVDAYKNASLTFTVFNGSKYKFQNMSSETMVSSDMGTITVPTPITGYIKIKNAKFS